LQNGGNRYAELWKFAILSLHIGTKTSANLIRSGVMGKNVIMTTVHQSRIKTNLLLVVAADTLICCMYSNIERRR